MSCGRILGYRGSPSRQCRVFGKVVGREEQSTGTAAEYGTVNMNKVECIVDDEMLDEVIAAITSRARTGAPGDGKIAIYNMEELVKIRTGVRGTHVT